MMASLQFVYLLLIVLNGSALTLFDTEDMEKLSDALSETADPCQDCTQIFNLLIDLLSNADFQKKIIGDLDRLCALLPGPQSVAKICKEEVEKIVPLVISFIPVVLKPDQICKDIGLCGSTGEQQKLLSHQLKEALEAVRTLDKAHSTGECSFCLFLIKTLESMLPKVRTEATVIELLQKICRVFPPIYRHECETIVGKFGKTVIDMIVSFATPQAICNFIHLCKTQEEPHLDLCSLKIYSCRDVKTAVKCGTVFYCQKFLWTPRRYYTSEKATWDYIV